MGTKEFTSGRKYHKNLLMSGTFTPSGMYYTRFHWDKMKNEYKNAYNTDLARERGLAKETEDMGDV